MKVSSLVSIHIFENDVFSSQFLVHCHESVEFGLSVYLSGFLEMNLNLLAAVQLYTLSLSADLSWITRSSKIDSWTAVKVRLLGLFCLLRFRECLVGLERIRLLARKMTCLLDSFFSSSLTRRPCILW